MTKNSVLKLLLLCVLLSFAGQAQALPITPDSPYLLDTGPIVGADPQSSNAIISAYVSSLVYPALELYKAEVDGGEEGALRDSYRTEFLDTPEDPSGARIEYEGSGDIFADPAYLLVKDGDNLPYWYLFDLSGWDGMQTIYLSGFWLGRGAISHVSLYGSVASVPEPATMLLLGAGLLGMAGVARKKRNRN